MEIEVVKKLIDKSIKGHPTYIRRVRKSELYYENKNDILRRRNPAAQKLEEKSQTNPLRNADNRISHGFHGLLVDQKASYAMTVPPSFDVGDEHLNSEIEKLLGDQYSKISKDLAINASNSGVAWLHVWKDESYKNFFRYAVVDSKQIIPIYSKRLSNNLEGLLRIYEDYEEDGEVIVIYEYWNDKECAVYSHKKREKLEDLTEFHAFELLDASTSEFVDKTNVFKHDWGRIPFVAFRNNPAEQADLEKYKSLIDVYDKVFSGFINDIDDIQEVIFVLTNYGGEDKQAFLDDLKRYKMIKLDADEEDQKSNFETMAIEIPIEARKAILEATREAIFTFGQGVDPQKDIGSNNSGEALKYMYSLVELKASMLETEFTLGFAELIRLMLVYSEANSDVKISQTWTRTSISNELEQANIVSMLAAVTSSENIAKSNPLVEDWQAELKSQKKEIENEYRATDDYRKKDTSEDTKKGDDLIE